jgi:4-carboxymuconolactone decarboxylase
MRLLTLMIATLLGVTSTGAQMVITRDDSRKSTPAPAEHFTGTVSVEMLFDAGDPLSPSGGSVTFQPSARTSWHSHPGGQVLIVTAGTGRVQLWGQQLEEIHAGDVVRISPGQKHWHGASPRAAMTHIAITEPRNGSSVEWMESVTDEQYNQPPASVQATRSVPAPAPSRPSGPVQQEIAPGLAALTDDVLFGDVWRRPELSARDRSLVTISVLIATGKPGQLAGHLARALDNGVQPSEASGLLAHLAIYCGWPSAVSALEVYEQVYRSRHVDTAALRASGSSVRSASDATGIGAPINALETIAPKFVQLTNTVVVADLWRRTDLSVRDRSLVTVAALAAMGDEDQLDYYLRRAIDSGLTRAQLAEGLTHLAFYAGWPKATRALEALARTERK